MKSYGFLRAPIMAFFSRTFYRDVAMHWRGTGIVYLFLLLAVCWVPNAIRQYLQFEEFCLNEAPKLISQIPAITIENGEVSVVEAQPCFVDDPETGERFVAVDTTGSIATPEDANVRVLLNKNEVIIRKSDVETRTFSLAEIKHFSLDKDVVTRWLDILRRIGVPALYVLSLLGSLVFRCLQALLYACLGMLFVRWRQLDCPYPVVYRLSIVCLTPCILVKTVLDLANVTIPLAGLLYALGTIAYLCFAVGSQDRKANVLLDVPKPSEEIISS